MVRDANSDFLTNEEIASATPDELVEAFVWLARSQARTWREDCEDTFGDACVGLVLAAQKYDPAKGPFYAWATLWIKQTLTRSKSGQTDLIYLPSAVRTKRADVGAAREALTLNDPCRRITAEDIASYLGDRWTAKKVEAVERIPRSYSYHANSAAADNGHADDPSDSEAELPYGAIEQRDALERLLADSELPSDILIEVRNWLDTPDSDSDLAHIGLMIQDHIDGATLL